MKLFGGDKVFIGSIKSENSGDAKSNIFLPFAGENQKLKSDKYYYHQKKRTYFKRVGDTFGHRLPVFSGGMVLEVGCAKGKTTYELATIHYPNSVIIGMDNSPRMIRAAIRYNKKLVEEGRVKFILGDGYRLHLTFSNKTRFSAIFYMNNLAFASEHMDLNGTNEVIAQASRFLENEGHLLISADECYSIMQRTGTKTQEVDAFPMFEHNIARIQPDNALMLHKLFFNIMQLE